MSRKNKKEKGATMEDEKRDEDVKESEVAEEQSAEETLDIPDERDVELEALRSRVAELEEEIAKLKDEDLRYRAETENYKRRLRTDKENAVKYANEQLIGDLLTPLDNFSRALEAAEENNDFEVMKKGVEMVSDQLLSTLRQNWGLEMIEAKGKEFDPNEMEAYSVQEDESLDKEVVIAEFAKGWKLHGKVLRSAKVMVGKPKAN